MKITIDIDKLLAEGQISPEEYARLKALATEEGGSLIFNLLTSFGAVAATLGAVTLAQSSEVALLLGLLLFASGLFLQAKYPKDWGILGTVLLFVGTLTVSGGILGLTQGALAGFFLITLFCAAGGILAKRGLLLIIATLALAATLGAMFMYEHATYILAIRQPLLTVILFSALAWLTYRLSLTLPADYSQLALVVARTSLFLVNFGFWVGSLWGDSLWMREKSWSFDGPSIIPDWFFVWTWAIALVAGILWAVRQNRRWMVNALSVFASIHFYTQFFERLKASPLTLLLAGLIALGIAMALGRYNRTLQRS